jgi:cytochrome c biogenesis protein CcdA
VLLATGRKPVPRLIAYTLGTGLTYFAGGVVLALGPAVLLRTLVTHHDGKFIHAAELIVGILALPLAVYIGTRKPAKMTERVPTDMSPGRGFLLGAGITFVDLPTAFMYFGAIALVVGADINAIKTVILLGIFCVAYVAPLIAITVVVAALGDRADPFLAKARVLVANWSQRVLALLTGAVGIYLIYLGLS